jgi:hypothetical protein
MVFTVFYNTKIIVFCYKSSKGGFNLPKLFSEIGVYISVVFEIYVTTIPVYRKSVPNSPQPAEVF